MEPFPLSNKVLKPFKVDNKPRMVYRHPQVQHPEQIFKQIHLGDGLVNPPKYFIPGEQMV